MLSLCPPRESGQVRYVVCELQKSDGIVVFFKKELRFWAHQGDRCLSLGPVHLVRTFGLGADLVRAYPNLCPGLVHAIRPAAGLPVGSLFHLPDDDRELPQCDGFDRAVTVL